MFKLGDYDEEPIWLDLPLGVRVRVRPHTMFVMESARAAVAEELRVLRASVAGVRAAQGDVINLPDYNDPAVQMGEMMSRLVKAMARYAILEWTGVVDEAGAEAAATPAAIDQIMTMPQMGDAFWAQYTASSTARQAEKNA